MLPSLPFSLVLTAGTAAKGPHGWDPSEGSSQLGPPYPKVRQSLITPSCVVHDAAYNNDAPL